MRIGLISDIHANAPALEAVLNQLSDADEIYCAGDIVGYNALPNRSIAKLNTEDVTAIRGNHDEAVLTETPTNFNISAKRAADWTRRNLSNESRQYLSQLDSELRESKEGLDFYITHGSPLDNLSQYVREQDVTEWKLKRWFEDIPDVIVLGHTHQQFTQTINDTLIINPGSVGQPRDGDSRAAYAILDTKSKEVQLKREEYDIDKIAERTQAVLPRKLADRLYEGR